MRMSMQGHNKGGKADRQATLRKRPRRRTVIIYILALAVVVALGVSAWAIHTRRLRDDMEGHIASMLGHIRHDKYPMALSDARKALDLAERLRDEEVIATSKGYIELLRTVIRGNDLFYNGEQVAALDAFISALALSHDNNGVGHDYIESMIHITERYKQFYSLLDYADGSITKGDYIDALQFYKDALQIATELSYDDGVILTSAGISDVEARIINAKREEAAYLFAEGDTEYGDGNYIKSIALYEAASSIYMEIEDRQGATWAGERILQAEQRLEEIAIALKKVEEERLAAEREKAQESQGGTDGADNVGGASSPGGSDGTGGTDGINDAEDTAEDEQGGARDNAATPGAESNYTYNLGLDFDLSSMIDDQNQNPASLVKMGVTDGRNEGWYNGCGWVAAYNALILLQNPQHPADIVKHYETGSGTVLGGVLGTYPHAIEGYFNDLGYNVGHVLFPQLTMDIDNAIKAADVAILAYAHTSAAHYITIEFREEDGMFVVYNDGSARSRSRLLGLNDDNGAGAIIDSIAAFLKETPSILFPFSLITISR